MKLHLKSFAVGLIVATVGMGTVFAASGIQSASFNTNKVNFKGNLLDLGNAPMVSVVKDGEENASNYMPVRSVLEQMGYDVNWDGVNNTVVITEKQTDSLLRSETEVIGGKEKFISIKDDTGNVIGYENSTGKYYRNGYVAEMFVDSKREQGSLDCVYNSRTKELLFYIVNDVQYDADGNYKIGSKAFDDNGNFIAGEIVLVVPESDYSDCNGMKLISETYLETVIRPALAPYVK